MRKVILILFLSFLPIYLVFSSEDHAHDKHPGHDSASENPRVNQGDHDEHEGDSEHEGDDEHNHKKHGHKEQEGHAKNGHHDEHGDDDEHGSSGVGPGKAILEVAEEGNKFRLSGESETFLGIQTVKVEFLGDNKFSIPKNSIVTYEKTIGIYVKSGEWFRIEKVNLLNSRDGQAIIVANNLDADSLVASAGLGFLRAAHLQASGQGGKGHAH